jgi:predicted DNA-binding transcriptional regulator YafY
MPANRNALIRYKTLDKCLQNRFRKWTLDDLIDAVSDALYEYEGIDKGISKRTVQGDIQMMRSDKLGYNAPITVIDKRYYTYEDKDYSITNIPLTDQDLSHLTEAVEFLKQFQGFSHFKQLGGMVQKLEDHIYSAKEKQKPVISFDSNPNLRGLEYLDQIYQAIIKKTVLKISYQSFKAKQPTDVEFHPYLLKEFNNRWFILGRKGGQRKVINYALDRIQGIELLPNKHYHENDSFDPDTFYRDVVGVTVMQGMRPEKIVFRVNKKNAQYVITKPIHHSQKLLSQDEDGATFELFIKVNFELERIFLGYGNTLEILSPPKLRQRIKAVFEEAMGIYE